MSKKRERFILSLAFVCALAFFIAQGCANPNIQMPDALPPIVKEYKHSTVVGGSPGMRNTGVYLEPGDAYSILATGSIDFWPRESAHPVHKPPPGFAYHDVRPELGWPLLVRVGERYAFNPFYSRNGISRVSDGSGHIYLGYRSGRMTASGEPLFPDYYRDDKGAFSVDIIVWKEADWIKIADYLSQVVLKDPDNKPVVHAHQEAERYASIMLAEKKAKKEIEKTEQQISELKKEDEPTGKPEAQPLPGEQQPTEVSSKEDKIAQLQARLAKLLESQAQVEEMKKELEEEKKKTSLLAEELGEKQKREQELLTQLAQGVKNPPVIMIVSPQDASTIEVNSVGLSGVAEDEQGIERLEIFINNKSLEEKTGRGIRLKKDKQVKRIEFDERISLERGENRIRIRAVDSDGFSSEKLLVVHHVEMRKNIWAVVIGINDYPHAPKLKYAVNDARAFYRHLVDYIQIPADNVTLLLDKDASLTQLRSALGTYLKNKAGKEDMVIIYFAGHGATEKDVLSPDGDGLEKYLLPYDADPKDLYASALPMREVSHIFYRIQSERLIFIADSCYSGASGGRTIRVSGIRANISDAFLERIAVGKGTIIMTASGANEVSAEDENLQHGVFTYYLLEGLKGPADADNDGLITVDEAYRYVSTNVPRATGQEQHPVKKGTVEGRLILSVIH
ncbi:MAG: caspase family protein [Desulfobacterales bacterium]|nr:MAG: caspase family protein [Desulfobacterales bacterium]